MANGDGAGRQRPTSTIGFLQCGHWGGGADFFSVGSTGSKTSSPGCQASVRFWSAPAAAALSMAPQ